MAQPILERILMDKALSETLIQLRQQAIDKYGCRDWGITFVDDRWIVGFLVKYKRYIGYGNTPQQAYKSCIEDAEGRF